MTNTVFGRLFYVNNYSRFSDNVYLKEKLPSYIDYVLYAKDDSYLQFLISLKDEYNHNNYMCVLENIINYVIKVFNLTFQDYIENRYDENIEPVLKNLVSKHNKLLYLYTNECDRQLSKQEKKQENKVYTKTKYKKHNIYTITGQTKR